MAHLRNSRFVSTFSLLRKYHVAAISWGLVDGKTTTKYAWDTPLANGSEPTEWFHEVFRKDGTPYHQNETELVKELTSKQYIHTCVFPFPCY